MEPRALQNFRLVIETKPKRDVAILTLRDGENAFILQNEVAIARNDPRWKGLLDLGRYLNRYSQSDQHELELLAALGDYLSVHVLGSLMATLWGSTRNRKMVLELPSSLDPLALELAQVPWDLARHDGETLAQRNVAIRLAFGPSDLSTRRFEVTEQLRILLCFSLGSASERLAMRIERNSLLDFLLTRVGQKRKVQVDILQYGTTRERLENMVRAARGYHIVHFSGHGVHDSLILEDEQGREAPLRGVEFARLFQDAGGFYPEIVFLAACHSGAVASPWGSGSRHRPRNLNDGASENATLDGNSDAALGTAHALVSAGIPTVVAMRYAVDDAYARQLGLLFYDHLIQGHDTTTALALARNQLARGKGPLWNPRAVGTPAVIGTADIQFIVPLGRAPQVDLRWPRPRITIPELARPLVFAGRDIELANLRRSWLEGDTPIAIVHGLAGMGKTSMAAEIIDLWHQAFDCVLTMQATQLLELDWFFREVVHRPLREAIPAYRARCEQNPRTAIWFAPEANEAADTRRQLMTRNLLDACRDYRLLLVLDNFESNLRATAEKDGHPAQDEHWDDVLETLAVHLRDTESRLLMTTRWLPQSLHDRAHIINALPLSPAECKLLIQEDARLLKLLDGNDADRDLLMQILRASGGHPLLLRYLTFSLDNRDRLNAALEALEGGKSDVVMHLSRTARGWDKDPTYFDDAMGAAIDLVLDEASPEAVLLLRVVTMAAGNVVMPGFELFWDRLMGDSQPLNPLFAELVKLGLLSKFEFETINGKSVENLDITTVEAPKVEIFRWHHVVKERLKCRQVHGFDHEKALQTYSEMHGLQAMFWLNTQVPMAHEEALEHAHHAIRFAFQSSFGDNMFMLHSLICLVATKDFVVPLLQDLQNAFETLPDRGSSARWRMHWVMGDALLKVEEFKGAIEHFANASKTARARRDWMAVGAIEGNWGMCLDALGRHAEASEKLKSGIAAFRQAGCSRARIVTNELGLIRIKIRAGETSEVSGALDALIQEIEDMISEFGNSLDFDNFIDRPTVLQAAVMAATLQVELALSEKNWTIAIGAAERLEATQIRQGADCQVIMVTRRRRAGLLLGIKRYNDAKLLLEECLEFFRAQGDELQELLALRRIAEASVNLKEIEHAKLIAKSALALAIKIDEIILQADIHRFLAKIRPRSGDWNEAATHFAIALMINIILMQEHALDPILLDVAYADHLAKQKGFRFELPTYQQLLVNPDLQHFKEFCTKLNVTPEIAQGNLDKVLAAIANASASMSAAEKERGKQERQKKIRASTSRTKGKPKRKTSK